MFCVLNTRYNKTLSPSLLLLLLARPSFEEGGLAEVDVLAEPGPRVRQEDDEAVEVAKEDATQYRSLVARLNYLSHDCPDLQFPIKQVSREMANPMRGSWGRLKKVARYLLGREK